MTKGLSPEDFLRRKARELDTPVPENPETKAWRERLEAKLKVESSVKERTQYLGKVAKHLVEECKTKHRPIEITIMTAVPPPRKSWFGTSVPAIPKLIGEGWVLSQEKGYMAKESYHHGHGGYDVGYTEPAHWVNPRGISLLSDARVVEFEGEPPSSTNRGTYLIDFAEGELPWIGWHGSYPTNDQKRNLIIRSGIAEYHPLLLNDISPRLINSDVAILDFEEMFVGFARRIESIN